MPREFGPSPEEMGSENRTKTNPETTPNIRQQDKITAVLKSENYELISKPSVEVSDADRQAVANKLSTGEIGPEKIELFLQYIQAPFDKAESRHKLSQDLLTNKDLGPVLTNFLLTHYRLSDTPSSATVDFGNTFQTLFLEEFPTPNKLEAYFQEIRDSWSKQTQSGNPNAKVGLQAVEQERVKWAELQKRIYGKRQEYWDQIKLMKAKNR